MGRDIQLARRVPVGLIHSSWGGTPAEAWTSAAGLARIPEMEEPVRRAAAVGKDRARAKATYAEELEAWYRANDAGHAPPLSFQNPGADTRAWTTTTVPALWETEGLPDFDGIVWYRKVFDLPAAWAGKPAELHLGAIDDADTTWVNGTLVGATQAYNRPRVYPVPAGLLQSSDNVIAIRVLDTGGGGGFAGGDDPVRLAFEGATRAQLPLDGAWRRKTAASLEDIPAPPADIADSPLTPTVLYNGMIAPLLPYAIRGVAWYQGESNANRPELYRRLLPALIADWRNRWKQGDFPFLFVQIAPHKGMPPRLREAQLHVWQSTPNTAMVVTTDVGDADDIHPARKEPVGTRLALAARALAYGERIPYSGPVFKRALVTGRRLIVEFNHTGNGLLARDGPLTGFEIAGPDKVFHPADAVIDGSRVVVSTPTVDKPSFLRYGWANTPACNLFNYAGLPATPFRTDADTPPATPAR